MLSPAALLFLLFFVGPVVAAIVLSVYHWDVLTPAQFAGTANFRELLHDKVLRTAIYNTFVFTFMTVIVHIVLGLGLALVVNGLASRVLRYFLRTALFFPMLVSWGAVSLLWKYALDPNFGFVNYYIAKLGIHPPNWLIDAHWALPSLVFIDLWRSLGYTFVILLAGLQTVPDHLYEAARVDGAGKVRQFWHVTLPMMSPTLLFAFIISFIGAFQIFDPMYIMTQGGPGTATLSLVQYDYYKAFRDFQMGYACAIALIIAAIILIVTLLQLRLSKLWVHYDR
jgi:multiple sugar transport system permease protein